MTMGGYDVAEEDVIHSAYGRNGSNDHKVRADMVYFPTPRNGAVFAIGSVVTATQSLPHAGGHNDMACVFRNVLTAFLAVEPLLSAKLTGEEKLWR